MASQFPLLCLSQFAKQCEEEIPTLRAEVDWLQVRTQEPREVVFADVLLQRPTYVTTVQLSQTRRGPALAAVGTECCPHFLSTYSVLARSHLTLLPTTGWNYSPL